MSSRWWDGTKWAEVTPRRWDGTAWVPTTPRVWDGTKWRALGGRSSAVVDPYPETDDPIITAMRPRRHTVTVTCPTGGDLTQVITDALAARGVASYDKRVLVLIEPGDYTATPPQLNWVTLVSTTGNPEDVTITGTTTSSQRGVMEWRTGVYMEGITLVKPSGGNAALVYPIHAAQNGTRILARSVLRTPSGYVYGADGGAGGTTTFYRATFEVNTVTSAVTNIHGGSELVDDPLVVQLIETTSPGRVEVMQHTPAGVGTGVTWAAGLTADALAVDHQLHISASTVGTVTAPAQDTDPDWPVPTDGLGEYDRRVVNGG